jgi:hypothetical protein
MGIDYGLEKFFDQLHYAVSSTDPLQERLTGVVRGISHLRRDSFPDDETYARFERLMKGNTMVPAVANEGSIQATTSKMDEMEAGKWLTEVLAIFCEIAEAFGKQKHSQNA